MSFYKPIPAAALSSNKFTFLIYLCKESDRLCLVCFINSILNDFFKFYFREKILLISFITELTIISYFPLISSGISDNN